MTLIFGLGSGRSGTHSLADLINHQSGAMCFHEMIPSCMAWQGAEGNVSAIVSQFQCVTEEQKNTIVTDLVVPDRSKPLAKMGVEDLHTVGDVALYYLPYVKHILSIAPNARFPCLKRDRDETIFSFSNKLKTHGYSTFTKFRFRLTAKSTSRNPWASDHDARWRKDQIWDRLFPETHTKSTHLEDYIADWYDLYYHMATDLEQSHPDAVRIFPTDALNSESGQASILQFCEFSPSDLRFTHVHSDKYMGS